MIPANLQPLANHLWQSTLFAVPVALLALALRKNRAAVRYWLWLAASVKFLIPFSLLVDAGRRLEWRSHPAISQPQFSYAVDQIVRPFATLAPAPPQTAAPSAPVEFSTILLGVWLCGAAIGAVCWFRSWRRINAAKRSASPLYLKLPIPAFSTPGQMEPGVFGIRKPVLLLPEGIMDRLTPAQLEAVFAHELCHVRRRDNLTAAIHTVVETIFWFHPLVWWIRARLVEEREHACDEEVLGKVGDAQDYAEGILNVCKLYLESPLTCVAGVMGSDLKKTENKAFTAPIFKAESNKPVQAELIKPNLDNAKSRTEEAVVVAPVLKADSSKPNNSSQVKTTQGRANPKITTTLLLRQYLRSRRSSQATLTLA